MTKEGLKKLIETCSYDEQEPSKTDEHEFEEAVDDLVSHGYTEDEAANIISRWFWNGAGEFGA